MINHKNFCRILAEKVGTITLSSNDQPRIRAFSIREVGSALGACSGSGSKGGGGFASQHRCIEYDCRFSYINHDSWVYDLFTAGELLQEEYILFLIWCIEKAVWSYKPLYTFHNGSINILVRLNLFFSSLNNWVFVSYLF